MNFIPRGFLCNEENENLDVGSREAIKAFKKKRPRLNFAEMDIPVGSILTSNRTEETITVQNERMVLFRGEEMPLTQATKTLLDRNYDPEPTPHWLLEGKSLKKIYNETYGTYA